RPGERLPLSAPLLEVGADAAAGDLDPVHLVEPVGDLVAALVSARSLEDLRLELGRNLLPHGVAVAAAAVVTDRAASSVTPPGAESHRPAPSCTRTISSQSLAFVVVQYPSMTTPARGGW